MVYFIQNATTKAIKIGISSDPQSRLAGLQTGVADQLVMLGTIDGGREVERKLHIRFSGFHLRGEWFRGSPELEKAIRDILGAVNGYPNLWEECVKRDECRYGLADVKVAVAGEQFVSTIASSYWNADGDLMVRLKDTRTFPARQCVLRSEWPEQQHGGISLDDLMSIL